MRAFELFSRHRAADAQRMLHRMTVTGRLSSGRSALAAMGRCCLFCCSPGQYERCRHDALLLQAVRECGRVSRAFALIGRAMVHDKPPEKYCMYLLLFVK